MKKQLLSAFTIFSLAAFGQGFPTVNNNWALPDGGRISNSTFYGFDHENGVSLNNDNTGSQNWFFQDMNGDKVADLVVAAQIQGGDLTCFSPGLNPYWKVYLSTWNGISTIPLNWDLPSGGLIRNGIIYGFNQISGSSSNQNNTGSQNWNLTDMNGDNKPDLVITGQLQSGNITCFSPGSGQYWKVYLNTGSSFSTTPLNWDLPIGGRLSGGVTYGYPANFGTAFSSDNTGSQSWSVTDINGDNKADLVVTAQLQAGNVTCFSPGASQYWKAYLNTGNGFSATAVNWNLPNGGKLNGGTTFGYDAVNGFAYSGDNTGSQTWSVMDIDGDKKADLIVTAQLQAGNVTCFSPGSNQYWKVFSNTGNGFAASPVNWSLPNGGRLVSGITYGYDFIIGTASSSDNTGSQTWTIADMDGFGQPELVVTAQLQAGNVTCFSPGNNQYWKVYKNSPTGFSSVPINCSLPIGGKLAGGVTYGFNASYGAATPSENTGSQSWMIADMNHDAIPDLVITGQLQGGNVTSFSPTSSQYWKVYKSNFETGIFENSRDLAPSFQAFPNPNKGTFTIKSSIEEKITLNNEVGQVIKTLDLNAMNNYSVEISDLQSGIYFVSGKTSVSKIVVIN